MGNFNSNRMQKDTLQPTEPHNRKRFSPLYHSFFLFSPPSYLHFYSTFSVYFSIIYHAFFLLSYTYSLFKISIYFLFFTFFLFYILLSLYFPTLLSLIFLFSISTFFHYSPSTFSLYLLSTSLSTLTLLSLSTLSLPLSPHYLFILCSAFLSILNWIENVVVRKWSEKIEKLIQKVERESN